ncbi:MAG: hypothetical protein LBS12_07090 [Prevotellaceae bacterium]|jgi:hypothetical protein|nr:hypothetical protein [Prevotellaceae bacterium]
MHTTANIFFNNVPAETEKSGIFSTCNVSSERLTFFSVPRFIGTEKNVFFRPSRAGERKKCFFFVPAGLAKEKNVFFCSRSPFSINIIFKN